ncbi:MAG: DUF3592 domain-containing protein [Pseudomonadales bacterium]
MKGRLFPTLLALPFAGFGAWMLWSIVGMTVDAQRMADWRPVSARLDEAGYHSRSGDDSTTYQAYARYRYRIDGRDHTGTRVGIGSGADNIGDYQRDIGSRLASAWSRGEAITVFVDPDDSGQAIIDPTLRWEMVGFQAIFVLVFGGVGVGLLVFAWRRRSEPATDGATMAQAPWLANADWQSATVRSGSRTVMWGAWAFAALWNLISAPLPFIAWNEVVDKGNHAALLALLFPLVGVGLAIWAIRRTREWRRFGPAPLTLDPFPGSIGGHVGGRIALAAPLPRDADVEVTLTCLHSYVSGTGRNRSRREDARWQDSRGAHLEPVGRGSRLSFRFEVPDGLPEADARRHNDSYDLWRLNVRARLPGADLDRDYDVPVYATATRSAALPDPALARADDRQRDKADADVAAQVRVRRSILGNRLYYPVGRHLSAAATGVLFGLAFAGAGGFFLVQSDSLLFGLVFGGVGTLIALASVYLGLNSLEVYRERSDIVSVRRLLGVPISRRRLNVEHFAGFDQHAAMKSNSGGRQVISYSLRAVDQQGHRITVGDGFRGDSAARAGMRLIARELGLDYQEPRAGETLPDQLEIRETREVGVGH